MSSRSIEKMISAGSTARMKQDDKFFSSLMSKESSSSSIGPNPSFRIYYGVAAGSVPFEWESRPGTPKHALNDPSLPPLTPPPSYFSEQYFHRQPTPKLSTRSKLSSFFTFSRFRSKNPMNSSSLSSLSSFSLPSFRSSSSLSSMVVVNHDNQSKYYKTGKRNRFSSFDSSGTTDSVNAESPTSTLCFGISRTKSKVVRSCHMG